MHLFFRVPSEILLRLADLPTYIGTQSSAMSSVPYRKTEEFVSITAMSEYSSFSFEEIRDNNHMDKEEEGTCDLGISPLDVDQELDRILQELGPKALE